MFVPSTAWYSRIRRWYWVSVGLLSGGSAIRRLFPHWGDFCKTKRALLSHMQAHYGGGYRCDFPGCESVFKENAKLKRHKLVHTGVKAWKCSYCHLAFSLKHNLKMHEKTHTRTDLLKCRLCNYQTIQRSNLRLHEATHGEAGVKIKRDGR